jgi:restriction endonuclease S subunit
MTAMQEQKESEVGTIPADWSIASLGDLGSCIRGVSYKPEHLMQKTGESVTTLLRSNNIKNDRVNFADVQFVDGCKISEGQLARPFDIAICMSNGSKALVGKSGVITPAHLARHPRLTVGAFCSIYRSPVQYTAQIFKSQFFQSAIDVQLAGSAINNLKGSDIEGIRFPLPPHEEQQEIAAILTAVDDKLDMIARQIEATQALKQGLMQTLFSRGVGTRDADGRWLPHTTFKDSVLGAVPTSWGALPIGRLFEVVERPIKMVDEQRYRRVTVKRRYGGVELRDELRGNEIKVKSQFELKEGDFLISERQIVHGACGIVPRVLAGALVSNEYLVLRATDSVDVRYFNYLVQQLKYAKYFVLCSQGVDIEKFLFKPKDWLKKLVPVPPQPEQTRIADVLSTVDAKLDALRRKQVELQQMKRGLMQKLLTGEWRVKVDAEMAA